MKYIQQAADTAASEVYAQSSKKPNAAAPKKPKQSRAPSVPLSTPETEKTPAVTTAAVDANDNANANTTPEQETKS